MGTSAAATIDKTMERASQALNETDYFACETLALDALTKAYAARDFERMARIVLPLQEARRQKRLAAADTGKIIRLSEREPDPADIEPACYLFEPMLVGAHGRNLRDAADELRIPVLVVVREPLTKSGHWPIVMLGPVTVRARVAPPTDEEPTIEWMLAASEALGDAAIDRVDDDETAPDQRVQSYLELLSVCPEHEKLHQSLERACRDAAKAKSN